MKLPSKELYIDILNIDSKYKGDTLKDGVMHEYGFDEFDNTIRMVIFYESKNNPETGLWSPKNINIYELMHLMKEWANKKDYWCISGYEENHQGSYYCMLKDMPDNKFFYADTEFEAVTKACEWILKQKG